MLRLALASCLVALPALAEPPRVVTDIPAIHSLAAQVMGDLGAPALLLDKGADAHDFQMRPSQARALADADLVFWVGPEMTPWLDRALANATKARSIALLESPGTTRRQSIGVHSDDGGEQHRTDPHAWLDPSNAIAWIGDIADELARADTGNAATYAANAASATAEITKLDTELRSLLAPAADHPIVVYHDAYGYLADHFGLARMTSLAGGDAADPGAARLSDLRASLTSATCVFPEASHPAGTFAALTDGTTARIGRALDPEGRNIAPGPDLYAQLMTGLARTIADCAGGQ
jgi:zinc transport system substrate-binding protein